MSLVIGIDPGKDETGIVLVEGSELLRACLVSRKGLPQPDTDYLSDIAITVREYHTAIHGEVPMIAVEAINPPSPHMGLINPSGALGTAKVFGAILALWSDAVVVEPDGNGSGDPYSYPVPIQPARAGGKGHDANRHLRSAYDVALAGRKLARLQSSA